MVSLYKPYMPNSLPLIDEILQSGSLAYGKWGKLFEKKLEEYIGTDNVLTTNSFNSAMQLCIATLGLAYGDEVLASPMSCLASNQPFVFAGLKVKWVDINPKTGAMCPESLEKSITKNTKAIFHNHFAGYVGEIDTINDIARRHGIFIVEDAIEAFGSLYKGRKIGNTGADATVFSFQTVRLPNTIDGGAVVFRTKEHYDKAVLIRDYGIDRNRFRDSLGEITPECDISIPGLGATLSEINSYIGCLQLEEIDELLLKQRENAISWTNQIQNNFPEIETVQITDGTVPNYWVYGLRVPQKVKYLELFRSLGFYASGLHLSNTNYSVFGEKIVLQGVEEFNKKFIAIPCGWWVKNI